MGRGRKRIPIEEKIRRLEAQLAELRKELETTVGGNLEAGN